MEDKYIDSHISAKVREENAKRDRAHSGRLSASMLGLPLQWQVLMALNCPAKPIDDYTLRKFLRGNHVEEWVVSCIPNVVEKQKRVEYMGIVGNMDALCLTTDWDTPCGTVPVEIKSVTNMKFKRLEKSPLPDHGHLLQGALYALAEGCPNFAILYVASDDYRIDLTIHEAKNYQNEIHEINDRFNAAMKSGVIPKFEPIEKWQADPKYQKYPLFADLEGDDAKALLEKLIASTK